MINNPPGTIAVEPMRADECGSCNLCRTKFGPDRQPLPRDEQVVAVSIQLTTQGGYEFRLCREHAGEMVEQFEAAAFALLLFSRGGS